MKHLLILLAVAALPAAETIVVEPGGAVSSLSAARDRARQLRRQGASGPITVRIRKGTYRLAQTFALGAEDADTVWEAAPGERVVISGGRPITGWKKGTGSLWTAPAGEPYFRQLFVGGRRAQRARTPNFGFYRIQGDSSQDKPFRLRYRGADIRPEWAGRGDVEAVALLAWADLRMPIVSVDEESHTAALAGDPRPSNREKDARYFIENAPDALDAAGEWYLDRKSGLLTCWPLPGEDLAKEEVIAPALVQLVRLDGAKRVVFRGLEFAHADWTMDPKGYADTQAAIATAPTAFEAAGAEECVIENCVFRQIGGYAVSFGRGCKRNRVAGALIYDAGGGGIKIGETVQRPDETDRNRDNSVTDSHIHDLGLVFPPAIGIWIGQSSGNLISHNDIHDLFYTAISVGWTWGYGPNQCRENIVEYNHLHHIGKEMLSDMGGIYTLGIQPGTVLRYNLIHDVASFTYGGWGIYPDEGTSNMLIENNVVYRCKSAGFHQHYGRENIVRNNVFAFNREHQLIRTRAEPHLSFTFERNIVLWDQGRLLGSNWTGEGGFRMNNNVYWDLRGAEPRFSGRSWEEWRAGGQDAESRIADPMFVDAGSLDFRLRPGSPALAVGFQPIELSGVGPRNRSGEQKAARTRP